MAAIQFRYMTGTKSKTKFAVPVTHGGGLVNLAK